ncbi:MAG: hypothetical protein JKY95_05675 [Planctomycetaceae bacterium]|nr:hypothetical protein [Planctomycetaceae bacterium]
MPRYIIGTVLLLLILFAPAKSVLASGSEYTLSGSDLVVEVNTKWIGCREGGYFPIRTKIRNIGKARTITLELQGHNSGQNFPTITRSVTLEQNATINTSLLVPVVSYGTYANFRILERGRPLKNLAHSVSLPEVSHQSNIGSAMLIVANKPEDKEAFNQAVNNTFTPTSSRHGTSVNEYTEHLRPNELPANWLGYTGLDILAIPLKTLTQDLPADTRKGILQWVFSGGTLIIYNVEEAVAESDSLKNVLDLNNRAFSGKKWSSLNAKNFKKIAIIDTSTGSTPTAELEDFSTGDPWDISPRNFGMRTLGLGNVIAVTNNPFPGTVSHWTWLLGNLSQEQLLWHKRHGITPRAGNESFFHFLIPNVGRVPIFSLLILITIFTILIGPVNYIYYLRKRQLAMLLVTVPIIAFGSSLTLLAYSTMTHGFSVKSRVRSVTFLDQKQNHAMSINRVAYFAGMAPSDGLSFEPTTAVYPIWSADNSFEAGRIDWSEKQHLQNGWLRSRTRTQFLTVSQQEQRGRLDLQESDGSNPKVSNGLEWNLKALYIVDEAGKAWKAKNLKSGAIANLEPVTKQDNSELRELLSEYNLSLPLGVTGNQVLSNSFMSPRVYRYYGGQTIQTIYQKSLQEVAVSRLISPGNKLTKMQPGSYFAVLKQPPDLELGLKKSSQNISVHLLFGYF